MPTRITALTDAERSQFDSWADRWISIGLRTGSADRAKCETAVEQCYRYAGIEWPGVVVWVPSPIVLALAAPTAAVAIEMVESARRRRACGAVGDAVGGAVGDAVRDAVRGAVGDAPTARADQTAIQAAVLDAIRRSWFSYIGGQLWAGGWYYGGAYTSFFREVCGLQLKGDLWDRGRAYEATIASACWWWPHRRFVMVCERPTVINRELTDPSRARGWGSHRLHCDDGPAVAWPDGWGVWAIHGVRVTQQIVEAPDTLTPAQIRDAHNAEVRRIMLGRFGEARFVREIGAQPIHSDKVGDLYRVEVPDDEPLVMVRVLNSTPDPDGSAKPYWIRVPPDTTEARQAIAWSFGLTAHEYRPAIET